MTDKIRLIDAEKLKWRLIEGYNFAINEIRRYIDDMPIVDIEELLKEREWISVKDKLPPVHFNVLVYCGGNEYHIARIDRYLQWYVEDGDYQLENEPEMWMPLPEPPESEDDAE